MSKKPERLWFVVQTRVKAEQKAAKALRAAGYRVYLPVMKKTIRHHRTKARIDRRFVLFNRYLFMSAAPEQAVSLHEKGKDGKLKKLDGVDTVLGIELDGHPTDIPREAVKEFMLAQRRGAFDDIDPKSKKEASEKRFPVGSKLRVRTGDGYNHPFGGFYGQVIKVKGKGVVRAMVSIFNRLVPMEFEPREIETSQDAA